MCAVIRPFTIPQTWSTMMASITLADEVSVPCFRDSSPDAAAADPAEINATSAWQWLYALATKLTDGKGEGFQDTHDLAALRCPWMTHSKTVGVLYYGSIMSDNGGNAAPLAPPLAYTFGDQSGKGHRVIWSGQPVTKTVHGYSCVRGAGSQAEYQRCI
jgi:hypothetical protein